MAKKETKTMEIVPTTGTVTSPLVIQADEIEEAVVLEETTEEPEAEEFKTGDEEVSDESES